KKEAEVSSPGHRPYGGKARVVPGRIQAEDYDVGANGVAYHDNTAGNRGGNYRNDDVDVTEFYEGGKGHVVGWWEKGEWLKYTVNVQAAGTYTLKARAASALSGTSFRMEVDGSDKTGNISIPKT